MPPRSEAPLHVLVLYGTRPEAIKLAPVIRALGGRPDRFRLTVATTGQHREMLDQVQELFSLTPDVDLDLMRPDQGLNELAARAFAALDPVLVALRPDWLLVQGDTTSAAVGALAAFNRRIRVGHVEAGLRTGDLDHPFPEEANRRIIDVVAAALFAPTALARDRLLAEMVPPERVHATGNTVVDALREIAASLPSPPADHPAGDEILVTVHRRESFGEPIRRIFAALGDLAERFPDLRFIYPVHKNPNVRGPAWEILGHLANVELAEPFDYRQLVLHLARCRLVLTDSGGIQEEAPTFGKPVLVLRETTERPEGVHAGVARLLGSDRERIVAETSRLLTDPDAYNTMARIANPYGDGRAAERIVAVLAGERWEPFEVAPPRVAGDEKKDFPQPRRFPEEPARMGSSTPTPLPSRHS